MFHPNYATNHDLKNNKICQYNDSHLEAETQTTPNISGMLNILQTMRNVQHICIICQSF
jgi:hypothetical protein